MPRSPSVAVLGGGPAGLTAARVIKLRQPGWHVDVYERHRPEQTYGYGVGLRFDALKRLSDVDPVVGAEVEEAGSSVGTWTFCRGGDEVSAANQHGVGLSRSQLLSILGAQAERAGAVMHTGRSVSPDDVDADVVIAADGVASATRSDLTDEIGAVESKGRLAYMWCGADLALDAMVLALAVTPAGPLAAHVMPYGPGACTFQVDAHEDSLAAWGLDEPGEDRATPDFLERQYADLLGGHKIETKRAEWSRFVTVSCQRWSAGRIVLAGDAAHSAHYTVGSGTGMAIDDGIALAEALVGAASPGDAFTAYEAVRRPIVERVQRRAARSQMWWSTLASRVELPLPQLMVSYLTRTGGVTLSVVADTNASLLADCLGRRFDGPDDLVNGILAQPLQRNGFQHPNRIAAEAGDVPTFAINDVLNDDDLPDLVVRARALAAGGATQVRLTGPPGRDAVLDRLDAAEQIRAAVDISTIVSGSADVKVDLALGLLSNRTDLVELAL